MYMCVFAPDTQGVAASQQPIHTKAFVHNSAMSLGCPRKTSRKQYEVTREVETLSRRTTSRPLWQAYTHIYMNVSATATASVEKYCKRY